MRSLLTALLFAVASATTALSNVQPIPGSIIYDNPEARLQKSPVGSTFQHVFTAPHGNEVREVYRVNADRTLTLLHRSVSNRS